ncbi:thermonuclease family protein [Pseudaestuariivita atlantica]|uniref:Nuclease n=1 Tax=Pseudaestuariivita atlantica TaxID=1317121 RepID=A0A0L1JMB7_9RHOB|nr:thermonuclease family protein [Pseudaestuariivita atlantica]KNG92538.1 nuclease [Pseudaestuariivita atlantica]
MLRFVNACITVAVAAWLAGAASAEFAGKVRVIDGDTFDVGGTRVRLHGIDAPEQDQTCDAKGNRFACGVWVTAQVNAMYGGRVARCEPVDRDRYGRVVARCRVAGRDVGEEIVAAGLARAYRRYSMAYDLTEKQAEVADRGLWSFNMTQPSWHRQTRAVGRLPVRAECRIKGNVSSKGSRIYHVPGQVDYERTGIREERGERWFCTEAEARASGWRRAKR